MALHDEHASDRADSSRSERQLSSGSVPGSPSERLERDVIGWLVREPSIVSSIGPKARAVFANADHKAVISAIEEIHSKGGIPTPASVTVQMTGADEPDLMDYLRVCMLGAPAFGSLQDLKSIVNHALASLQEAQASGRRKEADQLLREQGADVIAEATALLNAGPGKCRFSAVPFNELDWTDRPEYLVEGLLPLRGLAVMYGQPKCGKSFLGFDISMHVARGCKFRDRHVEQGAVAYLALEGAAGFAKRAAAFRIHHEIPGDERVPLLLFPIRLDLVVDREDLVQSIDGALDGTKPRLLVIDTLNRSMNGSESSDEDMGAYISAAQAVQERLQCSVLIIHHSGIDESRPRGHTSLGGAVDTQISVKRDKATGTISAKVERQKDDGESEPFLSRLAVVELGRDINGAAVTSCVIVEATDDEPGTATRTRLTDRQRAALDALTSAISRSGQCLPPAWGLASNLMAASVEDWRQEIFSKGVLSKDASNPRADFKRLKTNLAANHLIAERDGIVWPAKAVL